MLVNLMYMIPRELFNIGGYQDKEHVNQTLQGIPVLRILNLLNHSTQTVVREGAEDVPFFTT